MLGLASQAALAGSNTDEAYKLFKSGQYDAAERLFNSELGRDAANHKARYGLTLVAERKGQYDEMLEGFDALDGVAEFAPEISVRRAKQLIRTGQYSDAKKALEKALKKTPDDLHAMVLLGRLYYTLGRKNEGDRTMNAFVQLYNKGKADTAERLTYVGIAMFSQEAYEDANQAFTEASAMDATSVEPYVESGFLYLEKYNQRDADVMFSKALELDPNHPLAHVGMARVFLDSDSDFESADKHIQAALAVNPNLVEAMAVKADMFLADEAIDDAQVVIEQALAINPKELHVLALKASAFYLADDEKSQKATVKELLKINKNYAEVYCTMAHYGEIAHRYRDGITLYEKALELDKNYWRAFVGLGIAYTRIGDDEKGFEYLQKGYDADPYNVRAFNMVELYDRTLKQYDLLQPSDIRYRFHKDELGVLELYMPPLIDGALSLYERKYKFKPIKPISVEIFADLESFSVRSVGLPAINPQGICFGQVITARSPNEGNFNWAQVLWHELAHVFHLQMSDNRVPRWFTEGLAEFETVVARKEWRRELEIEMWLALKHGTMLELKDLNYGFTHAKSLGQVVVAYYQSSLVIEYMEATYGFDKLVDMLKAWGEHKKEPEVFQEVLGVSMDEVDAGFKEWLGKRMSYLDGSFELDIDGYVTNYAALMQDGVDHPDDSEAVAEAGLAELFAFRLEEARALKDKAIALNPDSPRGNHLGGIIALRESAFEDALKYYDKLISLGIDGYTIRCELGFLHLKMGQSDKAIEHYDKAKTFYPNGEEPYRELSKLYLQSGEKRKARAELEKLVQINQNDYPSALTLANMAWEAGETNDARRYGEIALDIYPFEATLHQLMGQVGVKQEDWLLAEREYLAFLVTSPTDPFEGYLGLAEVYVKMGQKQNALDYIERAKATRPGDARISAIEAKLPK